MSSTISMKLEQRLVRALTGFAMYSAASQLNVKQEERADSIQYFKNFFPLAFWSAAHEDHSGDDLHQSILNKGTKEEIPEQIFNEEKLELLFRQFSPELASLLYSMVLAVLSVDLQLLSYGMKWAILSRYFQYLTQLLKRDASPLIETVIENFEEVSQKNDTGWIIVDRNWDNSSLLSKKTELILKDLNRSHLFERCEETTKGRYEFVYEETTDVASGLTTKRAAQLSITQSDQSHVIETSLDVKSLYQSISILKALGYTSIGIGTLDNDQLYEFDELPGYGLPYLSIQEMAGIIAVSLGLKVKINGMIQPASEYLCERRVIQALREYGCLISGCPKRNGFQNLVHKSAWLAIHGSKFGWVMITLYSFIIITSTFLPPVALWLIGAALTISMWRVTEKTYQTTVPTTFENLIHQRFWKRFCYYKKDDGTIARLSGWKIACIPLGACLGFCAGLSFATVALVAVSKLIFGLTVAAMMVTPVGAVVGAVVFLGVLICGTISLAIPIIEAIRQEHWKKSALDFLKTCFNWNQNDSWSKFWTWAKIISIALTLVIPVGSLIMGMIVGMDTFATVASSCFKASTRVGRALGIAFSAVAGSIAQIPFIMKTVGISIKAIGEYFSEKKIGHDFSMSQRSASVFYRVKNYFLGSNGRSMRKTGKKGVIHKIWGLVKSGWRWINNIGKSDGRLLDVWRGGNAFGDASLSTLGAQHDIGFIKGLTFIGEWISSFASTNADPDLSQKGSAALPSNPVQQKETSLSSSSLEPSTDSHTIHQEKTSSRSLIGFRNVSSFFDFGQQSHWACCSAGRPTYEPD